MEHPIDFVVTWLDSTDPKWQQEFSKYKGVSQDGDQSSARYREWNLFRYWFRAVENYAPWVNKVFLVTNGTFPKWINPNHPKLVLVKHSDYIPEEFLPTFNSCTIELHMNKIPGLAEHFVYFNDDCYINGPITSDFYFRKGLPCDNNTESILNVPRYSKIGGFFIWMSMMTDIGVINAHFDRRKTVRNSRKRWYGFHLGKVGLSVSLFVSLFKNNRKFVGFNWRHIEQPFLKSVLNEAWQEEADMLNKSCTRFREEVILNPYFFRYWQFATNRFYPVRLNKMAKYQIRHEMLEDIMQALGDKKVKSLCLNDNAYCSDEDFLVLQSKMASAFEEKLPKKSSFEL